LAFSVVCAEAVASVRFAEALGRLPVAVAMTRHATIHRAWDSERPRQTLPTPKMQIYYFLKGDFRLIHIVLSLFTKELFRF
jgi:hypothetical protein